MSKKMGLGQKVKNHLAGIDHLVLEALKIAEDETLSDQEKVKTITAKLQDIWTEL